MVQKIIISEKDFPTRATQWIEKAVFDLQLDSIFLPAGSTPIPLYEYWNKTNPKFLSKLKLVQVDEVISGKRKNMFRKFFLKYLPHYAQQFIWIDRESGPLPTSKLPLLAILGLGVNGHLAFHEPHLKEDFAFGEVVLEENTCLRLGIENKSLGLTYGLGTFLKCKKVLLLVTGESKREILKKVLNLEKDIVASKLLLNTEVTIMTDLTI